MKTVQPQLTLNAALLQLQALNVAIRLTPRSIAIWSPNTPVPCIVRRTIQEHKAEVRQMIEACRIEVCPSVAQHRQEWYFPLEQWIAGSAVCGICLRLACVGESTVNKTNFDKIKVRELSSFDVSSVK